METHKTLQTYVSKLIDKGGTTMEGYQRVLGWYGARKTIELTEVQAKFILAHIRELLDQAKEGGFTVDKRFTIITANTGNIHTGSSGPRNFYATFAEAEEAAQALVRSGKMPHGVLVTEVQAKVELDTPPVKTTRFDSKPVLSYNYMVAYVLGDRAEYCGHVYRARADHHGVYPDSRNGSMYWDKE
jgi:hypothetical protein